MLAVRTGMLLLSDPQVSHRIKDQDR